MYNVDEHTHIDTCTYAFIQNIFIRDQTIIIYQK
jgi:hypothetical protein